MTPSGPINVKLDAMVFFFSQLADAKTAANNISLITTIGFGLTAVVSTLVVRMFTSKKWILFVVIAVIGIAWQLPYTSAWRSYFEMYQPWTAKVLSATQTEMHVQSTYGQSRILRLISGFTCPPGHSITVSTGSKEVHVQDGSMELGTFNLE